MKLIDLARRCLLPLPLLLAACATAPTFVEPELPPVLPDTIGRLRVHGPNAYLDKQLVGPGTYVRDGQTVSTGPGTSVILVLNDGGEIQLDENTDPLFRQGTCLLMKIFRGKAALRNKKCQEFESVDMAGLAHSHVHIDALDGVSYVTVIDGMVTMRSPSPATLGPNTEYVATAAGVVQIVQLTPAQASARQAWTRKYFPSPQTGGLSPAQAAGVGAAICILWNIFDGRKRGDRPGPKQQGEQVPRDDRREPARQPETQQTPASDGSPLR